MKSRYNGIQDYFKTRRQVIAQATQWVGRALPKRSNAQEQPEEGLLTYYVAPAREEDAAAWDEMTHANSVYLWGSNGHELRAIVVPLEFLPEGVKTHEGRIPFATMLNGADAAPKRVVTLSAKQLREAIAPGADKVTLLIPTEGEGTLPIEIASITGAAQIGYAVIVPFSQNYRSTSDWRVRRPDFRPFDNILRQFEEEGCREVETQADEHAELAAIQEMALAAADEIYADIEYQQGQFPAFVGARP